MNQEPDRIFRILSDSGADAMHEIELAAFVLLMAFWRRNAEASVDIFLDRTGAP